MYNLDDFYMNNEAKYSISRPYESKQICDYINSTSNNTIIIDGTAGVGGDTANFSKKFKKVYSFELNYDTFTLLQKNIQKFNIINVELYNDDFINLFYNYNELLELTPIIYIDPQWGGHSYKYKASIKLSISNKSIEDIIDIKNNINKDIIIYMKCPFNTDTFNYSDHIIDKHIIYNKLNCKVFQILKII